MLEFLCFSNLLFFIGLWGLILNNRNLIIMLMSIELMLLAVNFNFLIFSIFLDDIIGQIFSLFILIIAASEAAIGLSILVIYFRCNNNILLEYIQILRRRE